MNSRQLFRALISEFLAGCLLAGGMTGCASMPETGAASNGQPLRIVDHRIDDSHYQDVEVGKSDHYNSNGDYTGTSVQTQTQFVRDSHMEYDLFQGSTPIDAQDFMRIAGDVQGAAKLEADRKQGVWLNNVGLPLGAAGLALGYFGIQSRSMGSSKGQGSYWLYTGGAVAGLAGVLMYIVGKRKARALKVLTAKNADDMRILDQLDEDLRHPPAPSEAVPPPPVPASAPLAATSPASEVVARYATGSLPLAALRLVDAAGQTLVETHADGTLWAGAQPAKVAEIHGGSISWLAEGNACAVGRDGSFYAFKGSRDAELTGKLEPAAGIYRNKAGDYYQVLKDGKIKSVENGKSQMLHAHFAAAVPSRARALAAVLAAVYAKS